MLDDVVEQPAPPWRRRTTGTAWTAGDRRIESERDAALSIVLATALASGAVCVDHAQTRIWLKAPHEAVDPPTAARPPPPAGRAASGLHPCSTSRRRSPCYHKRSAERQEAFIAKQRTMAPGHGGQSGQTSGAAAPPPEPQPTPVAAAKPCSAAPTTSPPTSPVAPVSASSETVAADAQHGPAAAQGSCDQHMGKRGGAAKRSLCWADDAEDGPSLPPPPPRRPPSSPMPLPRYTLDERPAPSTPERYASPSHRRDRDDSTGPERERSPPATPEKPAPVRRSGAGGGRARSPLASHHLLISVLSLCLPVTSAHLPTEPPTNYPADSTTVGAIGLAPPPDPATSPIGGTPSPLLSTAASRSPGSCALSDGRAARLAHSPYEHSRSSPVAVASHTRRPHRATASARALGLQHPAVSTIDGATGLAPDPVTAATMLVADDGELGSFA